MRVLIALTCLCFALAANSETITVINNDNSHEPVILIKEQIRAMPQTTYTTNLPWIDGQSDFTGVKVTDFFEAQGIELPEVITISALNHYAMELLKSDIEAYQPIIAYLRDSEPMSVREKGPYWLIYSLSDHPQIDNSLYHSQMVWQMDKIELHADKK